jgi:hypothetical protein
MNPATQFRNTVATAQQAQNEPAPLVWLWFGAAVLLVTQLLFGPSRIESIVLAAAPLLIVPLACDQLRTAAAPFAIWQPPRWATFFAASLAAVAIPLNSGWQSAIIALPWTLLTVTFAATNGLRGLKRRATSPQPFLSIAAVLFLAVGGLWLFASCAGADPFGFGEPIIRLTAIHFHYAGFVLTTIAARVAQWYDRPAVTAAMLAVPVGIPLVALGIALRSPAGELAATLLLASAAIALAVLQFVAAVQSRNPQALALLGVASISLGTAMVLAFLYAFGRFQNEPALDIPVMIATHGLLNAVGFSLCGLLGWRCIISL